MTMGSFSPGPLSVSSMKQGVAREEVGGRETRLAILQNRTMEEIVGKWSKDLDGQVKMFHKQAIEISRRDKMLIEQGEELCRMYEEVCRAEAMQREMDQNLEYLEAQQRELEKMCEGLEREVQRSVEMVASKLYSGDIARERMYTLSESVGRRLENASGNLDEMVEEMNRVMESGCTDENALKVLKIMNAHMDVIRWADGLTGGIQRAS